MKPAKKNRIHTFIATSPIHMEYKLRKNPDQVLEMAVKAVKHACQFADEVEFSPEDACRSDPDFLVEVLGVQTGRVFGEYVYGDVPARSGRSRCAA